MNARDKLLVDDNSLVSQIFEGSKIRLLSENDMRSGLLEDVQCSLIWIACGDGNKSSSGLEDGESRDYGPSRFVEADYNR